MTECLCRPRRPRPAAPWNLALVALLVGAALTEAAPGVGREVREHPGYVDGRSFAELAGRDGRLVEVNLHGRLLNVITARAVRREDEGLAAILGNLVSMQAVIAEVDRDRRDRARDRAEQLVEELESASWEPFVRVRDAGRDEFRAFVRHREGGDGDETICGLTVIGFADDGEFIFVNLAGDVDVEHIAALGERFGVPGLDELVPPHVDAEDDGDARTHRSASRRRALR